jgi:type II secretory pathway component GspD/PulD (secretin)
VSADDRLRNTSQGPPPDTGALPPGSIGVPSVGAGQAGILNLGSVGRTFTVTDRLIVSAPKMKLAEIQRLIEILDTDKPEDVAVRMLPLKNVNAQDVVKEVAPLYQRMSGRALKDMIEIAADDRSSSLIVLSSEANFKAIEKLMTALDAEGHVKAPPPSTLRCSMPVSPSLCRRSISSSRPCSSRRARRSSFLR